MSEMAVAGRALNFGPRLPQRIVFKQENCRGIYRLVERGPAAVAVELGAGHEQLSTTSTASVKAGSVLLK